MKIVENDDNGFFEELLGKPNEKQFVIEINKNSDQHPYADFDETILKIIKTAQNYLNKHGLEVNPYNGIINFYHIKLDGEIMDDKEEILCGNDISIFTNYHTCIIYLQKDDMLNNGNLTIYPEERGFMTFLGLEESSEYELDIKQGTVVVINGVLNYSNQNCSGYGIRNYIEIHLESLL
jgi:hypothetical protein